MNLPVGPPAGIPRVLFLYGMVLAWLAGALLHAMAVAIDLPAIHLDGAFRTAGGPPRLAGDNLDAVAGHRGSRPGPNSSSVPAAPA